MPNPNPVQNENLKANQFKKVVTPDGELAEKPCAVRLPKDIDQILRQFPDRNEFLREVISKAVRERVAS